MWKRLDSHGASLTLSIPRDQNILKCVMESFLTLEIFAEDYHSLMINF